MTRALLAMLVLCAACNNVSSPSPPSMPWLHGFSAVAASNTPTARASRRIADLLGVADDDDYGALELRTDLAADERPETVLASHSLGVAVLDPAGRLVGRAPGFDAGGSADDLISLAAGDGELGTPLIILAVQTGGHRESTIWLAVYRLAGTRSLQELFRAPVETHDGDQTRTGALTFVRAGLFYRAPGAAAATWWTFDARRGRYVEREPAIRKQG